MRFPRGLLVVSVVTTLVSTEARAVEVDLHAGGGYWFSQAARFDLMARVVQPVGGLLELGGRAGVLVATAPGVQLGIPVDLTARLKVSIVYFDVFGGPTFLLGTPDFLRASVGGGFGFVLGSRVTLGVEASYLQPSALLMLRLGFRLT